MISDDQDAWTEDGGPSHYYHNQRIGKERRRFLLVSAFDVVLVSLLWVLHTVSRKGDWSSAFEAETDFADPDFFKNSLFDVTLFSFVRSLWLIVWYAGVRAKHWIPVACSTCSTTIFLLVKCMFYFRGRTGQVPEYSLILAALIVSWVELWLLPFSVLRKERRRQQEDRRTLVVNDDRIATTDDDRRFDTAYEFSDSSDEGGPDGSRRPRRHRPGTVYRPFSNTDYIQAGKDAMESGKQWYEMVDTWTQSSKNPVVRWMDDKQYGRIYYLKDDIDVPVKVLFDTLYEKSNEQPKWNKQCLETKRLLRADEFTDVFYSISAPALRGYISSREFLDVRYYQYDSANQRYMMANVSVASTIVPISANKKLVRGENGPNLWVLSSCSDNPNHSSFEWVMNTNLKGDIPKRLVERSLSSFLVNFSKALKTHLAST